MIMLKNLQLLKEMITQLAACQIVLIPKTKNKKKHTHYKIIATELSKQQAGNADPKAIQQNNFTGNLEPDGNTTMLFILEKVNETILDFPKRSHKSIVISFCFHIILR